MPKRSAGQYAVGYCRPPACTQFKPGHSGNPRGRPKGTKNLQTDVLEEIRQRITIREGDKAHAVSKQRALVKAVVMRALKGDTKAIGTLVALLLRFQEPIATEEADQDLAAEDRALIERFVERVSAVTKTAPNSSARSKIARRRAKKPSGRKR